MIINEKRNKNTEVLNIFDIGKLCSVHIIM
jgi:hypothetical protein